jgi:hypothetical protein
MDSGLNLCANMAFSKSLRDFVNLPENILLLCQQFTKAAYRSFSLLESGISIVGSH